MHRKPGLIRASSTAVEAGTLLFSDELLIFT